MKYRRTIDPSLMRFGDILNVTSGTALGAAIRAGQAIAEGESPSRVFDAVMRLSKPSHSLFVVDPARKIGREMTLRLGAEPDDVECDLAPYFDDSDENGVIVSCCRNPFINPEHNPDACDVTRQRLQRFIEEFRAQYSPWNLFNFLARLPQDKRGLVCSQYCLLGWIVSTICEGYFNPFPTGWIVAGSDNVPWPGMVSPVDLHNYCNMVGWCVPFCRYEEIK
jgi:hypothetical protein